MQVPHRAMLQTYFVPVSYSLRLYLSSLGLGDRPEQPPWRLLAERDEPKLTSMPLPLGLDNRPEIILEYPASSKDSSTDWTSSG